MWCPLFLGKKESVMHYNPKVQRMVLDLQVRREKLEKELMWKFQTAVVKQKTVDMFLTVNDQLVGKGR